MKTNKPKWESLDVSNIKKFEGVTRWKASKNNDMNFKEALDILKIPEFEDRIINSNSKGELMHVVQYYEMAELVKNLESSHDWLADYFSKWFKAIVEAVKKEWKRPESVYQHVEKLFKNHLNETV